MTDATLKLGRQLRAARFDRAAIDEEARTVPLTFSSEEPFARWWGVETLGHGANEVNLDWLKGGTAPLLADHDTKQQVGVVLPDVMIGADRKGRAMVRFGNSPRAEQEFRDVRDGIRANVSVGYEIEELRLEKEEAGVSHYRVTKWRPLEISLVSIPADMTVGVGRDAEAAAKTIPVIKPAPILAKETRTMDTETIPAEARKADTGPSPDQLIAAERKRVNDIADLAGAHNRRDLGDKAIRSGISIDQFRAVLLENLPQGKPLATPDGEIGMSKKEVERFSLTRALLALTPNSNFKADFEMECSRAVAQKLGQSARGMFIPYDMLVKGRVEKRDLVVGTPTAGGNTVATELDAANMIELLRNRMMVRQMGARVLSGLQGNIAIPKVTGGATAYWVAENADSTESQQTIGQVPLSPKTVTAYTDYSRQLLLQSSIDVEGFIRDDLATTLALAFDLAALHGTGASNQPTGLAVAGSVSDVAHGTNGDVPTWAKVVEFETDVAALNADVGTMGYLTNAKVRGKLKTTEVSAGTAVYLWPDMPQTDGIGMLNGYRAGVSNQVRSDLTKASGSALSAMFFGNWADMIIAEWGALDILVNPFTGANAGTTRVHVYMSGDIALRRAESFSRSLDIVTV